MSHQSFADIHYNHTIHQVILHIWRDHCRIVELFQTVEKETVGSKPWRDLLLHTRTLLKRHTIRRTNMVEIVQNGAHAISRHLQTRLTLIERLDRHFIQCFPLLTGLLDDIERGNRLSETRIEIENLLYRRVFAENELADHLLITPSGIMHPGELFKEGYMVPMGYYCTDMEGISSFTPSACERFIQGSASINEETANELARLTGTHASSWSSLQTRHTTQLTHAKKTRNDHLIPHEMGGWQPVPVGIS